MQVALNLCRWLASRWADSLTEVTAVNVCVYCGRLSAAIMSESFELFVQGSSIIKLDCFEFLPENAASLEGVGGYVSHPSLKLISLIN